MMKYICLRFKKKIRTNATEITITLETHTINVKMPKIHDCPEKMAEIYLHNFFPFMRLQVRAIIIGASWLLPPKVPLEDL